MRFLISLYLCLLLLINGEIINGQAPVSTTVGSDPCYNYTTIDEYWRDIRQNSYQYYDHDDSFVEWSGWYRLYLNGESAQMSEWCVSYIGCGGYTGLYLSGSHPRVEDGVVTREVVREDMGDYQCGQHTSNPIQVKACPGDYYVYKLVTPEVSIYRPSYCAVSFKSIINDPCYNYESLDRPWRASTQSELYVCDESFSWNGWYRLYHYGMNIKMSENCVNPSSCNAGLSLSLDGPHPQIEDGVVTREVCGGDYWNGIYLKSKPIRVKACPGNYYVYELVKPIDWCSGYCTDVNTAWQMVSTTTPAMIPGTSVTLSDPCFNHNILDNYWRNTHNYWFLYGYVTDHDDTRVEWDGWYRLFINGSRAQMPDWCVFSMSCGGFSSLWLGGSHPQIEDGVVTREVYGSLIDQCSRYTSNPIQVKACPGDYYVYKLTRPNLEMPAPVYCAVPSGPPSVDPCDSYTSLDEFWRTPENSYNNYYYFSYSFYDICDYNVDWNGWYRLFINGQSAQIPESCVSQGMCGTDYPMWLRDPHPQLEDGVVTQRVCMSSWDGCCGIESHPIRVKACPGNYYVYELVRPMHCGAYCTEVSRFTTQPPITQTSETPPPTFITPPPTSITPLIATTEAPVDPCYNYNLLDDVWRATNNLHSSSMCDMNVNWEGWYRLFIQGQSVQMPDSCVEQYSCGTSAPLWLNGEHPRVEDGVVTRDVCGHWNNDCCHFQSNPIRVKACADNYYVYEFVRPTFCHLAYCADVGHFARTTVRPETTSTTETSDIITAESDPCSALNCTEDEWCGEKNDVYGCFCNENQPRPDPDAFDFSETCESSSGSISISRCQLFEAGFPAHVLHLNDPSCGGTIQNGRVEFHFDNNDHICGTSLVANGTHIIYENFILGTPESGASLISRERILKLSFSCIYPQTQTLSMIEINPLETIVHKNLAGHGMYRVRMIPYQDSEFSRPFTANVNAELNQQIFVEVRVDGVDSRQFAAVIDTCWATPVNDPDYSLRWDLITGECPNPHENTVELVQNGVSTSSRFSFRMFIFSSNATKVYLHCAVHLCLLTNNDCSAHCYSGHDQRMGRSLDFHDTSYISMGPLVWSDGYSDKLAVDKRSTSGSAGLWGCLIILLVLLMSVCTIF